MSIFIRRYTSDQKKVLNSNEPLIEEWGELLRLVGGSIDTARLYASISIKSTEQFNLKEVDISNLTKVSISFEGRNPRLSKKGYRSWAVGNCLTTMSEGLFHYVDRIIEDVDKKIPFDESLKIPESLYKKSIEEKLKILLVHISEHYSDQFPLEQISEKMIKAVGSIRLARNCIVHHNGIVRERITNEDGIFELGWFYIKDFHLFEDGSVVEKSKLKRKRGRVVDVCSDISYYCKKFKLDSQLDLSPFVLFRIGFFILHLMGLIHLNLRLLFDCDERQAVFE